MNRLSICLLFVVCAFCEALIVSCRKDIIFEEDQNPVKVLGVQTGLPVIKIDTPDRIDISSKYEWLDSVSIVVYNVDGSVNYESSTLSIKGRGNTSWEFPKKPYALKLSSKAGILGMKKHKRWCLLANWMDRTLMRNDIAFHIARQTDLAWTPIGEYVELILNGKHLGNYFLCEQIKVDKNRLNITEMKSSDIAGDALTGGYLMELDINYDEVYKFYSGTRQLPYMFKSPDDDVLQVQQFDYLQSYINTLESCLYSDSWLDNREYADYLDIGSFIDWWFVNELSMNGEAGWPKSSYVYKDRLGKLHAGPVWDFDWGTFMPEYANQYAIVDAIYYERLFQDPAFRNEVKKRWSVYKSKFENIPSYVRAKAVLIKDSNEINLTMWPLSVIEEGANNGDADLSFDEAVERLITAYTTKLNWLDEQITNM